MIVYLDGENVVYQIMDVLRRTGRIHTREDLLRVNIATLIKELVGLANPHIKYYTTTLQVVKTDADLEQRSQDMVDWGAKWVNHLTLQGIEVVKAGKLKAREGIVCKNCGHQEAVFREKGVDVRLAVDLLVDSETEKMLVIWSSDSDLLPAVEVVKTRGARVKNLAHDGSLNWGLARQCGEWQTYTDKQLIKILQPALSDPAVVLAAELAEHDSDH